MELSLFFDRVNLLESKAGVVIVFPMDWVKFSLLCRMTKMNRFFICKFLGNFHLPNENWVWNPGIHFICIWHTKSFCSSVDACRALLHQVRKIIAITWDFHLFLCISMGYSGYGFYLMLGYQFNLIVMEFLLWIM